MSAVAGEQPAEESQSAEIFQRGVAEYRLKHYDHAVKFLDAACADGEATAEAFYYAALAHEQLCEYTPALRYYQSVIAQYPNSEAAALARTALNRPEFKDVFDPFSLKSRDSKWDSLPRETYIKFEDLNNELMVDGSINGRPVKMIFDTGAAVCCCSLQSLKQLGIDPPAGKPDAFAAGIGSKRAIPGWRMQLDVTVGRIERRRFPVFVSAFELPYPLLGQNFFCDFQYTIDRNARAISFKRTERNSVESSSAPAKNMVVVNSSGRYEYQVPFKMDGQALIVVAKINCRDCPVQFDTGAGICMFSTAQLDAVGGGKSTGRRLQISGAGGTTIGQLFEVKDIQLGPVHDPVIVAVSDQSRMKYPLLGQNFLKDLQYTIDYANHLIRFEK